MHKPIFYKLWCFIIVAALTINNGLAQDLVILKTNDSLNCKVLNEIIHKNIEIAFFNKNTNNIELLSIDYSNIIDIKKAFFSKENKEFEQCVDTIYTKQNEVIVGHILKDKTDWYIHYELLNKTKQSIAYSLVKKVVKCNKNDQNDNSKLASLQSIKPNNSAIIKNTFENKKYSISFNAILGLKPGNPRSSSNIVKLPKNYYDQQRFLYGIGIEFHRSINKRKNLLMGIQLNQLLTGGTATNSTLTASNGTIYLGELNTNLYFTTIGPNLLIKLGKNRKLHSCAIQLGLNWVIYNEKLTIGNYTGNFTGNGFSQSAQFQYNYKLSNQLSFAANLGLTGGSINNVTLTENGNVSNYNLKGNQAIAVSRASFSLGLVYSFK